MSDYQKNNLMNKIIEFTAWDNSQFRTISTNDIEILDGNIFNFQQAQITTINTNLLKTGNNVKITGKFLYSLIKEPYLIIKNVSNPNEYQFKFHLSRNNLNKEGTEINFVFKMDNAIVLNSNGIVQNSKMINVFKSNDYYEINFYGDKNSNSVVNFKISSLNSGNNLTNPVTMM